MGEMDDRQNKLAALLRELAMDIEMGVCTSMVVVAANRGGAIGETLHGEGSSFVSELLSEVLCDWDAEESGDD